MTKEKRAEIRARTSDCDQTTHALLDALDRAEAELATERANSAAMRKALTEAFRHCGCSLRERDSGHRVDCWLIQEDYLDVIESDAGTKLLEAHKGELEALDATVLILRKRIHSNEKHNQFIERCESPWCNPRSGSDPVALGHGDRYAMNLLAEHKAELAQRDAIIAAYRDGLLLCRKMAHEAQLGNPIDLIKIGNVANSALEYNHGGR